MKKNKGGRPSKYKPEYCEQIIEFFSIEPTIESIKKITTKTGTTIEETIKIPNKLPFLSAFARKIGVNQDTLHEWCKHFPKFSEAFTSAKELQKEFLIQNGLMGLYPPASFAFTAKNITDMRDQTDMKHMGQIEKIVKIYEFPDIKQPANKGR